MRITDQYYKWAKYDRPNLDISHRCILRCPQCLRQKAISGPKIKASFDVNDEDFTKIIDYYEFGVTFCGQISDPIYHPDFLRLLKITHDKGSRAKISTNGSGKTLEWWKEAYSYGNDKFCWVFGVDGIDKKSQIYRIGSDFENVWEMMKLGKKMGQMIVWQYIIFEYNEADIEEAKLIAEREGFVLLFIKSHRGFEPGIRQLRKSVKFDLKQASAENTAKGSMAEFQYYHRTQEFIDWNIMHPDLRALWK
jgi:MoaA/NifB/PqqE/SkfB family radical SAM enzyme